ncbi:hypothetical protein HDV05_004827 [Chytridiales sp. JEL 0842]|nr:hypothetical protein HDV05_004827 [Chytridiales sp. JEL 0842]
MPGVYLSRPASKRGSQSASAASTSSVKVPPTLPRTYKESTITTSSGIPVATDDTSDISHIQAELKIERLRNSVQKLLRTNQELREIVTTDPDPVYIEAIDENVDVIARQLKTIKKLEDKAKEIISAFGKGCGGQIVGGAQASDLASSMDVPSAPQAPAVSGSITAPDAPTTNMEVDDEGGVYL